MIASAGRCSLNPMTPMLKAPGATCSKLNCDDLLSNFALNFNLRLYASAGDNVLSLYPKEGGAFGFQPGIAAAVQGLPVLVPKYTAKGLLAELSGGPREGGEGVGDGEGGNDSRRRAAPRAAFVAYERPTAAFAAVGGSAGPAGPTLPCHISFLSARTNDAMVDVLGPLLPLAR